MKVLVTGGAGFIGSVLVRELLLDKFSVRVADNLMYGGHSILSYYNADNFEFVHGDIRDRSLCQEVMEGIDAVVHLAAIVGDPASKKSPELTRQTNLEGSRNIIESAQGVKKFIFASTCSNYGKSDVSSLADETTPLKPVSLYAETKVEIERYLIEKAKDMDWTILRLATVYGVSPRMRFDLTVNEFTMLMATKGELMVYGEQFWRPYIHVRDVARAIKTVLSKSDLTRQEIFNVGDTSQNFQKIEIVRLIQKVVPSAKVEFIHGEKDPRDYRVSFERIKSKLGYQTLYSVEDGINEVYSLVKSGIIKDFEDPQYYNVRFIA